MGKESRNPTKMANKAKKVAAHKEEKELLKASKKATTEIKSDDAHKDETDAFAKVATEIDGTEEKVTSNAETHTTEDDEYDIITETPVISCGAGEEMNHATNPGLLGVIGGFFGLGGGSH